MANKHLSASWVVVILVLPLLVHGQPPSIEVPHSNTAVDKALVDANLNFALDLYKSSVSGKNVFLSPFSISVALAMTTAGADGNTLAQMKNVMHLTALSNDDINQGFYKIVNSISSTSDYTLLTANKMFIEKTFKIHSSFNDTLVQNFKSSTEMVDFQRNADAATQEINNWVEKTTQGKIKDIFKSGDLRADTLFVLVNAIYFKGSWSRAFIERETREEDFYLSNGQKIKVSMMGMTRDKLKIGKFRRLQCKMLELPYKGDRLAMYVILPDEINGLESLQQQINAEKFNFMRSRLTYDRVHVNLPKFTLKYRVELTNLLAKLGMTDLFSNMANLSKISRPGLKISKVIHQTFVAVDEKGTTAAAVTGVVGIARSGFIPEKSFKADHPFMFIIYDNHTNLILFIGNVNIPHVK